MTITDERIGTVAAAIANARAARRGAPAVSNVLEMLEKAAPKLYEDLMDDARSVCLALGLHVNTPRPEPGSREAVDVPEECERAAATIIWWLSKQGRNVYTQQAFADPQRTKLVGVVLVALGDQGARLMQMLSELESMAKGAARS